MANPPEINPAGSTHQRRSCPIVGKSIMGCEGSATRVQQLQQSVNLTSTTVLTMHPERKNHEESCLSVLNFLNFDLRWCRDIFVLINAFTQEFQKRPEFQMQTGGIGAKEIRSRTFTFSNCLALIFQLQRSLFLAHV